MTAWAHCKSAFSLAFITTNLLFWSFGLVPIALVKLVWPGCRPGADRMMAWIYRTAARLDDAWLERVLGIQWDRPALGLSRDRSYIVLSNHTSWSDILLIQSVVVRDGPLIKFLVKRELLAVPILGLIFWAFDFPLLRRRASSGEDDAARRRSDLETLRAACQVVREHPAALVNFAEGTRFSETKRDAQASPYRYLLRPRFGGLDALLEGLGEDVEAVVDLTLVNPRRVSFWEFLSGALPRVRIEAELVPQKALPASREKAREWLSERWRRKDARIDMLQSPAARPHDGAPGIAAALLPEDEDC